MKIDWTFLKTVPWNMGSRNEMYVMFHRNLRKYIIKWLVTWHVNNHHLYKKVTTKKQQRNMKGCIITLIFTFLSEKCWPIVWELKFTSIICTGIQGCILFKYSPLLSPKQGCFSRWMQSRDIFFQDKQGLFFKINAISFHFQEVWLWSLSNFFQVCRKGPDYRQKKLSDSRVRFWPYLV